MMTRQPIDYKQFIHPQDKQALEALKKIPLLDTVLKQYMKAVNENLLHGINMASKIRLSPTQLPNLYFLLPPICEKLGLEEPEFFLEMDPQPNAYTSGDTKPFIVINSGLVELLKEDELKSAIAHECGHILCHHVLYHMLARLLISGTGFVGGNFFGLGDVITAPLEWALLYWVRRSEYSADRVSAYVMDDAEVVVKTQMRLSGGNSNITENVNLEEYLQQAMEYRSSMDESKFSKLLQYIAIKDATHPFSAIRAIEVREWFYSGTLKVPDNSIESSSTEDNNYSW